jgi:DNA-binding LacI/PurR family transcriptional regulator
MSEKIERNSDKPIYIQLSDIIKSHILSGKWGDDGQKLPPESELSEQFDVARGTLRQALGELEAEGFVQRERGRGTFIRRNRPLHDTTRDNIGFVVPYVRDSFVTTILRGVEREAAEHGLSVTFKQVDNAVKQQIAVLEELVNQQTTGIILYPTDSTSQQMVADLIEQGYPIVLIDRYIYGLAADHVVADNFGGALQAMQHLIQMGHQRIGFVTWREQASSLEHRAVAYRQAMKEAGLPISDNLYCEVEGYPDIVLDELADFLQQNPPLSAIFTANDQVALSVYKVAQRLQLKIPDDLALVGFGDIDLVNYLDVPLTTVALPSYEIGREAVQVLAERSAASLSGVQRRILPTQLVIRASCGFQHSARLTQGA